jgi:hypothetical protein
MDWTVKIEAAGDHAAERVDLDRIDALRAALVDHNAAASSANRRYGIQLDIDATTAERAAKAAIKAFRVAAERSGLPDWPVVRVDVMTVEDQEAALATPTFPDLVGVTEAARLLRVSRQRLDQLRAGSDFPEPIVRLAAGPVWLRSSIEGFDRHWNRRPGRPKKVAAADNGVRAAERSAGRTA